MSENSPNLESRRFGRYLRQVREDRKLSLDAVEEMSLSYPGRVTKSHLSRIENGQAEPTFPRMFALSRIYGVPITSLAERFESELTLSMAPDDLEGRSPQELREEADRLRLEGRYEETLRIFDHLVTLPESDVVDAGFLIEARLRRAYCLVELHRLAAARDDLEPLLGLPDLTLNQKATALYLFTICCLRSGRIAIARFALDPLEKLVEQLPEGDQLHYALATVQGNTLVALRDFEGAGRAYSRALKILAPKDRKFEECRIRINYGEALIELGKKKEAKRFLHIAHEQARAHGFDRLTAFALNVMARLAMLGGEWDSVESYCLRSNAIARSREFTGLVFRNCFYLWKVAIERKDEAAMRSNERALRTYLGRLEEDLPEADEYRRHLEGGGK